MPNLYKLKFLTKILNKKNNIQTNHTFKKIKKLHKISTEAQILNLTATRNTFTHLESFSKALPRSTSALSKRSMIESALRETPENCISITYAPSRATFPATVKASNTTTFLPTPIYYVSNMSLYIYVYMYMWCRYVCIYMCVCVGKCRLIKRESFRSI